MAGAGAGAGAGAAADLAAANTRDENGLLPKPLRFWEEQERFLQEQLAANPVPSNTNVKGLECRRDEKGRITFEESAFEVLSTNTKKMRSAVVQIKKKVPSYTQLLGDCQEYFYPYFVVNPGRILDDFKDVNNLDAIDLKELYAGKYDAKIQKSDYINAERVAPVLKELKDRLLERLAVLEDGGKPLCVYFFHLKTFERHGLAGVFWKKDGVLYAGFYDTLFFIRDKNVNDLFLAPLYVTFQHVLSNAGIGPFKILNLSNYCLTTSETRTHCIQYVMDAEYCSIYVFYFFYLYAKHGFPTHVEGDGSLSQVIKETYVVDPAKLRRDRCAETNRFRMVLIQFAMNTILLYTADPARHVKTYELFNTVLEHTGYRLLTEDMYGIAERSVRAVANAAAKANAAKANTNTKPLTGGRRKRTTRKTRRPRKHTRRVRKI
jgi:hypothetical protein